MTKTAMLLTIVLVTGLVAAPARADSSYGPPVGPLAFIITNGSLVSCYDMYARGASTRFELKGQAYRVNNQLATQAVIGYATVTGDQIVWGIEAFPTPAAQVAAKIGGLFLLSTLLGNGYGYHITPNGLFPFSFLFRLAIGPCRDFVAVS